MYQWLANILLIIIYSPNLMLFHVVCSPWRFTATTYLQNYTPPLLPCAVIIISIVAVILHFVTMVILSPEVMLACNVSYHK